MGKIDIRKGIIANYWQVNNPEKMPFISYPYFELIGKIYLN